MKIQSNGVSIHVREAGRGDTVIVFLHYWGGSSRTWRHVADALSSRFRTVATDHRGFSTCHVDNVVEALRLALDHGTGGRAYFINDCETTTFRDFIAKLAQLQGLSIEKVRSMPYRLAFTLGWLMEMGTALVRSDNDLRYTADYAISTG
ncbi:MAG: hypothetical protein ACREPY_17330 [Rhodanobacteraceae bacterium]